MSYYKSKALLPKYETVLLKLQFELKFSLKSQFILWQFYKLALVLYQFINGHCFVKTNHPPIIYLLSVHQMPKSSYIHTKYCLVSLSSLSLALEFWRRQKVKNEFENKTKPKKQISISPSSPHSLAYTITSLCLSCII